VSLEGNGVFRNAEEDGNVGANLCDDVVVRRGGCPYGDHVAKRSNAEHAAAELIHRSEEAKNHETETEFVLEGNINARLVVRCCS